MAGRLDTQPYRLHKPPQPRCVGEKTGAGILLLLFSGPMDAIAESFITAARATLIGRRSSENRQDGHKGDEMFGYMTTKEAVANGFTHHGKYFGIPVWVAPDHDFMVATKWAPMELVMTAAHYIEGFLLSIFYPNEEPSFQFLLGAQITTDDHKTKT